MGNSAVAVLHYDHSGEIRERAPRMADAMLEVASRGNEPLDFGFGRVVSWDHASGYQVCVIHGNTGWRVGSDEHPPPHDVLLAVSNALRVHGYRVEEPK